MSDSDDSDSSIDTEELNELQNDVAETFKEKEIQDDEEVKPPQPHNVITAQKKKKGRPPKPLEEKLAKQVITKEKIIYVIQDSEGNLIKKNPSKLGIRELNKMKREEEAQQKEIELGKKLARLKNGKAKIPKVRTAAQIAATERMLEANNKRRAGIKVANKQEKKEALKEVVKESVKEIIVEPAIPKPVVEKSINQQYIDFFS